MMAEAQSHSPVRGARTPFYFNSAEHLLRIEPQRAATLAELLEAIQSCRAESIFQHTFRTLQEHHFIREGFSNDFAHWAFAACNEVGLAERLASIPLSQLSAMKLVVNQAYENMGLASTQTLGPILDGLMRNPPDAQRCVETAAEQGVRAAIEGRDGPFGDYSQAPASGRPDPANRIDPVSPPTRT